MKIRIITIHGIPNFGSVFQSYALCNYLQKNGYSDTKLIDYNPLYFNRKSLRSIAGRVLNARAYLSRTKKFRNFVVENIPLTEKSYTDLESLKADNIEADVYIAGGDQLWNIYYDCGNDDAYKLTFAKGKKISYATSMGKKYFSRDELLKLAELIKDFSAVSVRESSSVELLNSVNIKAEHSVDPVYLLEKKDYDKFLKPVNQPDYLLVYLVTPSKLLEECIEFLSKKYNLKVILCSGFSKKCTCDEFLKDLGPDEILSYIANARIVLSSSFHATAFSVIFNKDFFTILPDEHTNERIEDLLRQRELSHRIITDDSNLEIVLNDVIDYSSVKPYSDKIEKSKEYLQKALADE